MGLTYKLTSPLMKGDPVKAFQRAMQNKGWYKGKVDGVYGELTAQAAYRSKYWLGYPKPDKAAGDKLYGYLTGKQTPLLYRQIAARRKKAALAKPIRLKMLEEFRKHVGVKESPRGSNNVFFSTWYGIIGPWCAMSVSYCGVKVGSKSFIKGKRYAYCPYILADAKRGINYLTIVRDPQPGDIALFDWDNDGVADHVGLFDKWLDKTGTKFAGVEGNTSQDNPSDGGAVEETVRHRKDVIAFVHVGK